MSLYEAYLSKSKEYLINEILKSWEENQKLQHQLEIQTKRVENLKKSNEFYVKAYPRELARLDIEVIRYDKFIPGKLARECQAKDQELEKQLEEMK